MKKLKIFAGTANSTLAKKVAQTLKVALGKAEIVRFADGECRIRIEEDVDNKSVVVFQSLCPPVDENLIELCLLGATLKRNGAQKAIAVVPYLGYARQDKIHRKGECLSAEVVAKIIEGAGFDKLITFDVHSEKALHFFKIPTENLSAVPVLAKALTSLLGIKHNQEKENDYVLVAPDKGAIGRVQHLAKILETKAVAIEKDRDLLTGKLKIKGIKGETAGKKLVLCDDMISSGGTLILAADVLKRQKAVKIMACAVHPVLVKTASDDLQKSKIEKVIVTDTIPVAKEKQFKKLEVVTVAPLIADAIVSSI